MQQTLKLCGEPLRSSGRIFNIDNSRALHHSVHSHWLRGGKVFSFKQQRKFWAPASYVISEPNLYQFLLQLRHCHQVTSLGEYSDFPWSVTRLVWRPVVRLKVASRHIPGDGFYSAAPITPAAIVWPVSTYLDVCVPGSRYLDTIQYIIR